MTLRFRCRCFQRHDVALPPKGEFACHVCGEKHPLAVSASVAEKNVLDACPRCGVAEFYLRRDFPPVLGVTVVAAGCVLAFALGMRYGFWPLFLTLAAMAAVDFWLYKKLPNAAVCYVCKSEFRGFAPNPAHGPFNLAHLDMVEARYRSEAERFKGPA
jgi:hypothetical protein